MCFVPLTTCFYKKGEPNLCHYDKIVATLKRLSCLAQALSPSDRNYTTTAPVGTEWPWPSLPRGIEQQANSRASHTAAFWCSHSWNNWFYYNKKKINTRGGIYSTETQLLCPPLHGRKWRHLWIRKKKKKINKRKRRRGRERKKKMHQCQVGRWVASCASHLAVKTVTNNNNNKKKLALTLWKQRPFAHAPQWDEALLALADAS